MPNPCGAHLLAYGIVEVACAAALESTWTGGGNTNDWDTPGNWTPSGRPADSGSARFSLGANTIVHIPPGRQVGQIDVLSGTLNLHVEGGVLRSPSTGCLPSVGSLGLGDTSSTAGFSLIGEYLCDRLVVAGYGVNSTANMLLDGFSILRCGQGLTLSLASGAASTMTIDGGRVYHTGAAGVVVAQGPDSTATLNVLNHGLLEYNSTSALFVCNNAGAHGIINVTGNFNGESQLVPRGSGSQIILGAHSPSTMGNVTAVGELNLGVGGRVKASEIILGSEPRTRGAISITGGTLDVGSLIIADEGIGTFEWTGGSITGLGELTLGRRAGTNGNLGLAGRSRSLAFTGVGGLAAIYVGKEGRGRMDVTGGAGVVLPAGATGGLSIGASSATGGGGVVIAGTDPENPLFRSHVAGGNNSVLHVGQSFTIPATEPALLIDQGRATFGTVLVGTEDWMDGEIHVRNFGVLQQTKPNADAIDSLDGLQIRGTPGGGAGGARLLVNTNGQVQCTSGVAFNTWLGGPVVQVTDAGSTLACSGAFYIRGDPPTGGKMFVGNSATMTTRDLYIGGGGGVGQPGEMTLSGPAQVLTVSGTLGIGYLDEPTANGRLVLQNGAKVRTRRLVLGASHFVTNGTMNNPQLMVGGSPLLAPDLQCDTLLFDGNSSDIATAFDLAVSTGGGIGGTGTWDGPFSIQGGEVIAEQGIAELENTIDWYRFIEGFTVAGNYMQDENSTLSIRAGHLSFSFGDQNAPINSRLVVQGSATLDGTLFVQPWTFAWDNSQFIWTPAIGQVYEILTASSIAGQFETIDLDPDFATNRVQLTYEPTRVLMTLLPPVCGNIDQQPQQGSTCPGGSVTFNVHFGGYGALEYRWYKDSVPLVDGDTGTGSAIAGAATPALTLTSASNADLGVYSCVISTRCGQSTSDAASLLICPADTDDGSGTGQCDGGVTIDDLLYYLANFEAGFIDADVDDGSGTGTPDGGVTIDDLLYYLQRFEAGC